MNLDKLPHTFSLQQGDTIFEHLPVGVALFDAGDFRLLEANALYHKFLDEYLPPSWKHGQAIGHPPMEWLPEPGSTSIAAIFRKVLETGTVYRSGEFTFLGFDWGTTYWHWTLDPLRDDNGRIVQLLLTATDVTEQVLARQQAEQAHLSVSEANRITETERKRLEVIETVARTIRETLDLESIGKTTIEAIYNNLNPRTLYIHVADPEKQSLQLLNFYTSFDVKQTLSLIQDIPYSSPLLIAKARKQRDPLIVEDMQIAASLGRIPSNHPLVVFEVKGYICIPLWFKDHFEGILSASFQETIQRDGPEVQTLVGCSTHIAAALAHARLHTTVENERARQRTVVDQLPEGILIIEAADGAVSYANRTAIDILGISLPNLIGFPLHRYPQPYEATDPNSRQGATLKFTITHALCGETLNGQEITVFRPDGSKAILLFSAAPLHIENGVVTGVVLVFQDITAQKSIEQQKNEFLSIASHELRTPITTIQGMAEILQLQVERGQSLDTPRNLRAINGIVEQSQHLTRLIEELLDISRLENAQLLLYPAPHNLLATLSQVIENQSITIHKHRLHLVLQGLSAGDFLIVSYDEERMIQVLNNLISNAIKYSPNGGDIEVGIQYTLELPSEVLLWVKDSGIGIPENDLASIFKRFHRASNLDHSISGLGIGLYLVHEVVTRHGGRVWVESTEGKGSTFYLLLPINKGQHYDEKLIF